MRVDSQPAYVLHTRNFRDTSLLVEVITADYGRISLVAKGARGSGKAAKHKRALIQPFNPLIISFSGKSELKTLTALEPYTTALSLEGKKLFSAFYVNELLTRLLQPGDEQPEIYTLYEWVLQSMSQLQNDADDIEITLRRFELKLLEYLGYGFDFSADIETGAEILPDTIYRYEVNRGFTVLTDQELGQVCFSGKEILAIGSGEFDQNNKKAAKRLCRLALKPHLGDKPLKSRELFI